MAVAITPDDLILSGPLDEDRALDLIATVTARAARFAPCILTDSTIEVAAKGILVDVISRRYEAQTAPAPGVSETVGGRTKSTSGDSTVTFWPGEIAELQALCADAAAAATDPVYSFPDAPIWPDGLCG